MNFSSFGQPILVSPGHHTDGGLAAEIFNWGGLMERYALRIAAGFVSKRL
jgi:hypothetical protein